MSKTMKHRVVYACFLFLLACSSGNEKTSSAAGGSDLSKFKLSEINGEIIDLAQYNGKTVFINVWATWCKPCIQEMPTIESMQKRLKDENMVVLMASNEEPELIEGFIGRHAYDFRYVRLVNMEALNIQALPTTFIFNTAGKIKFSDSGYRNWDDGNNIKLINNIINDHEE